MLPDNLYNFQMSDLHIDLVLVDCSCDDRTARAGDALVGRPAFSDSSDEPQWERVGLEDGRTLHVTYMPFVSLHQLSDAYSRTGHTDIPFNDQDAVLLATKIFSDLTVSYFRVCTKMLREICGEDFLRKKGIVALLDEGHYTKAQTEGKVKETFLAWCRQQEDTDFQADFQEVQERCILIDGNGTDVVLKRARKHLAHIVDYHITGSYTENIDLGFTEAEQRSQELEKQVIELKKKHVQIETAEVRRQTTELDETNTRKTTEISQQVELRFTELKQKLQEADEAHTHEKREMSQQVDNQVTELKQKLQEADEAHTRETREISQELGNQVTELKQKLQEADEAHTRETREILQKMGNQVTELKMDFEDETRG